MNKDGKLAPKEEAYARARADGKGPSDAYRASRDTSRMATATINSNAKRLERKATIKGRIEELRRESRAGRESSATAAPGGASGPLEAQQIRAKKGAPPADAPPGTKAETAEKGRVSARYRARAHARAGESEAPPQESAPAAPPNEQAAKAEEPAQPRGRPTVYSEDLAAIILARLAAGEPLRIICRDNGMPAESTVRAWALDPNHPLAARYAQAREIGFFSLADEILEIADDSRNDYVDKITKSGEVVRVPDDEAIARSRVRIAARQWLLSKALPHTFGDKLEHSGGLQLEDITPRPRDPGREVMREAIRRVRAAAADYDARVKAEREAKALAPAGRGNGAAEH